MDGPGQIPQQPAQHQNDLDAIFELIVGNTLSAFFWLFCIGGPATLVWWLFKNSRDVRGWKKAAWFTGAGFLVSLLGLSTLFFVYGLSRKVSALKGPVDRVVASVPLFGGWLTRTLGREVLPAPRLWHVLLAVVLVGAGFALWKRRRRPSSTLDTTPDSPPLEASVAETPVVSPVASAEPEPIPATEPPQTAVPIPVPTRAAKLCEAFGLKWESRHGKWMPLCPLCHSGMGIMDVQREGMWVASGGRETGSWAECSNPACKNRKSLPQTRRNIENRIAALCQKNATD